MKNKKMLVLVLALALAAFSVVPALAHGGEPPANRPEVPFGGRGLTGSADGFMHDEMVSLLADTLGVAPAEIEARLDSGETMFSILAEAGFSQEDIYALMQDFRAQSWQWMVDNGFMTAEQYEWMEQHMGGAYGYGGMMGGAYGYGGMTDGAYRGARGGQMGAGGFGDCTGSGFPMGGAYGSQNRP